MADMMKNAKKMPYSGGATKKTMPYKKSEPTTPPGENSSGRTYSEQNDYDRMQNFKKMRSADEGNPMLDAIKKGIKSRTKAPLGKGETFKVAPGSPNMAKRVALKSKLDALKKAKK